MSKNWLELVNVSQNNLKNLSLHIPLRKVTIITGVSGSGKTSLAFDTIYAEGQRRFVEVMNLYARNVLYKLPDTATFDSMEGLSPTIGLRQSDRRNISFRSTVGTVSEIYDFLRLIFTNCGSIFCPECKVELESLSDADIGGIIREKFSGEKIAILTPAVVDRKGEYAELFEKAAKAGFARVYIDAMEYLLPEAINLKLDRNQRHNIDFVVDRIKVSEDKSDRILRALRLSSRFNSTVTKVIHEGKVFYYNRKFLCPACSKGFIDITPRLFSFNSDYGMCTSCQGSGYVDDTTCDCCCGSRLNQWASSVKIADRNITELTGLNAVELRELLERHPVRRNREVFSKVFSGLSLKLKLLDVLGIGYLELDRPVQSISGGELQKLLISRLAAGNMSGLIYVFDEPSIGLHPEDCRALQSFFSEIRDLGNTLIIIEHEREIMKMGDYFVDFGLNAGRQGGQVVFSGSRDEFFRVCPDTCRYLEKPCPVEPKTIPEAGIEIKDCVNHNLQGINAFFPQGLLTCITGVSGAGKSSLLEILQRRYSDDCRGVTFRKCAREDFKFIRVIDKEPLGKSSRSTPATFTGIFDHIRDLYSNLEFSRIKGYRSADFSFNSSSSRGRCEKCKGIGQLTVEMNFLPSYNIVCDECQGHRYSPDIQRIFYEGMNIAQVLELTVDEACDFFSRNHKILDGLSSMRKFGLGYLKLGQPSSALSGGEAQRIKIAAEVLGSQSKNGIYLMEEPTTGLHFKDVEILLAICAELKSLGNTVIIIDNTYEIIASSDWLIELGPGASASGGRVVFQGVPFDLPGATESLSYKYLIKEFTNSRKV